jgi:tripartite-type tricarboxylate transporter receptor subunit TctC
VVAVSHKMPFKTVQEMTAYAKANPGRINFASNGNGSSAHIATALYETMAGVDMTHVPYKGLAPAMTDLMSGQVDIMFSSVVAITPQIKSGKLRALAVTSAKRSALLPDLPTLAELGLTGYEAGSWYGLLVPAGTPEAIVRRLNAESVKALRGSSVRDSLSSEGAEVVGSTPEEFARHIRAEHARIGKMIKDGRLKMEP